MNLKTILTVAACILVGIGVIKMSIIGYYPREAPLFISILVAGTICGLVANKIPSK